jgi:DNA-binding GntR family transcriptional regulator
MKATVLGRVEKRRTLRTGEDPVARELKRIETQDPGAEVNRTPRYLALAKHLQDAIQSGAHPVGSLLPTEVEIAKNYGVSRQTVRQAISLLRQQNMLSARKGVGTRVEAKTGARQFSYSSGSVAELLEVAQNSEFAVEIRENIVARGALAAELGWRSGHMALHLGGKRTVDGELKPLSWVDVYIDGRVAPRLRLPPVLRSALFLIVQKQTGEIVDEIMQEIRPTLVSPAMAQRLDVAPGAPALEITRRYYSTGRRLIQVSVNTLPGDRFFYSVAITRD